MKRTKGFTPVELPTVSRRQRAAFTLVELLVVVGIIAVLISLLLPAMRKARGAALGVACGSNMRQLFLAEQMYASDYRGWIGYTLNWNGTYGNWYAFLLGGATDTTGGVPIYEVPTVYVQNPDILGCPGWDPAHFNNPDGVSRVYGFNMDSTVDIRFPMPANLPQRQFVPYAIGYRGTSEAPSPWDPYEFNNHTGMIRFLNMVQAKNPCGGVMFADSLFPNIGMSQLGQAEVISLQAWVQGETGQFGRAIHLRHNNRANFLFWDGHVDSYDAKGLQSLGGAAWVTQDLKKYP